MLYLVTLDSPSQWDSLANFSECFWILRMSESLFDDCGACKYVAPAERVAFVEAALQLDHAPAAFCLTLAITGARLSDVLALQRQNIDAANQGIVFRTLKQRGKRRYRLFRCPRSLSNYFWQ